MCCGGRELAAEYAHLLLLVPFAHRVVRLLLERIKPVFVRLNASFYKHKVADNFLSGIRRANKQALLETMVT